MSERAKESQSSKRSEREKSTADLDRVTDYVEEREVDTTRVAGSMQQVVVDNQNSRKNRLRHEKELAAVKIQQKDVDLIVDEMGLDPKEAERTLRECRGDVVEALCALVREEGW